MTTKSRVTAASFLLVISAATCRAHGGIDPIKFEENSKHSPGWYLLGDVAGNNVRTLPLVTVKGRYFWIKELRSTGCARLTLDLTGATFRLYVDPIGELPEKGTIVFVTGDRTFVQFDEQHVGKRRSFFVDSGDAHASAKLYLQLASWALTAGKALRINEEKDGGTRIPVTPERSPEQSPETNRKNFRTEPAENGRLSEELSSAPQQIQGFRENSLASDSLGEESFTREYS